MLYAVEFKDRDTDQKYMMPTACIPYKPGDIIEATEAALWVARSLRARYEDHYKRNFDESWSEERKEKFRKLNSWSVRIKNDDCKTVLLITSEM